MKRNNEMAKDWEKIVHEAYEEDGGYFLKLALCEVAKSFDRLAKTYDVNASDLDGMRCSKAVIEFAADLVKD